MTEGDRSPQWERVQELFLEVLATAPERRQAFLDEACGSDAALRSEVESLLKAGDEGPLRELPDDRRWQGRLPDHIGEYRVVRPLGSGGMARVFLAVREKEGFAQTVALKLLSSGFAHPAMEARLREERRILARLEHPNIARFIDGGLTPDGAPFMAIEYVQGQELLAHCDLHASGVRARLQLFLSVCDALHHAHQQLVVHRDLKPSNVMVTADGRPKLLDFGVAKLMDEESADGTHSAAWLTPAYASPEQLREEPVTTLSDVYGLGLLLYELLTGTRPYRAAGKSPVELVHQITTVGPTRPSQRVIEAGNERLAPAEERAARFGVSPARLRRLLAGDLDVIVLRAMAAEPARRYASVAALAEDIRMHLEGRPVRARPDTHAYRWGRFLHRHRVAAVVASVAVVGTLAGLVGTVWQASLARRQAEAARLEAQRARQVADLVGDLFRLSDPATTGGDTVTALRLVEEGASRIEEELKGDPSLQAVLLGEVVDVYRNLGLLDRAEGVARRVVELLRTGGAGPALVGALGDLGDVLRAQGDADGASTAYREALGLAGDAPDDTLSARARSGLGWVVRAQGQAQEAAALFQAALAVFERAAGPESPGAADARMGLAATYHDAGRFDEAEAIFRSTIPTDPSRARADPEVAVALGNLGTLRRLRGHYREAELLSATSLDMRRRLYGEDHLSTLEAVGDWGAELTELGRVNEAREVLAEGARRARQLLGDQHSVTTDIVESLANALRILGEYDEALTLQGQVLDDKRSRLGDEHPGIAYSLVRLGAMALEAGLPGRAQSAFTVGLEMSQRLSGSNSVYGGLAQQGLAMWNLDLERPDDAVSLLEGARTQLEDQLRPDHRYLAYLDRDQALVRLRAGRPEGAVEALERVLAEEEVRRPLPHHEIGRMLLALGEARLATGDARGSLEAFTRADEALAKLPSRHWMRGFATVGMGAAGARLGERGADVRIDDGLRRMRSHLQPDAAAVRRAEHLAGSGR
jgi:serine/threonine protein kinase/Flp pilus assembly protein TadD